MYYPIFYDLLPWKQLNIQCYDIFIEKFVEWVILAEMNFFLKS